MSLYSVCNLSLSHCGHLAGQWGNGLLTLVIFDKRLQGNERRSSIWGCTWWAWLPGLNSPESFRCPWAWISGCQGREGGAQKWDQSRLFYFNASAQFYVNLSGKFFTRALKATMKKRGPACLCSPRHAWPPLEHMPSSEGPFRASHKGAMSQTHAVTRASSWNRTLPDGRGAFWRALNI